jgi:hypothetical protein
MPELLLLTPEDEQRIRDWASRYFGTGRGMYPITDGIRLLNEIDRLRTEIAALESAAAIKQAIEEDLQGWTDFE